MRRGPFFFFFCFSLFKTTKFVLGLPKWKFSTGKKNQENNFAPSEKNFPVTPLPLRALEAIEQSSSSFLSIIVHPVCNMKFADTCVWLECLCVKSTTQRNLKHKAPNVRSWADLPPGKNHSAYAIKSSTTADAIPVDNTDTLSTTKR